MVSGVRYDFSPLQEKGYKLDSKPLEGGCGFVARMISPEGENIIAKVPLLRANLTGYSPPHSRVLQREIEVYQQLQGNELPIPKFIGADKEAPYLVLELLPGKSLYATLGAHPSPLDVLIAGRVLCSALLPLHDIGYAHHDIHFGNCISPTHDGVPYDGILIDLATSGTYEDFSEGRLAQVHSPYTPPEGQRSNAWEDDVYALGFAMLAKLLGVAPRSLPPERFQRAIRNATSLGGNLNNDFGILISQMTDEDPTQRPILDGVKDCLDYLIESY